MANETPPSRPDAPGGKGEESWPAAEKNISLSQAILAPLDALFKAQIHSARSFLSFLLQMGYPHQPWLPENPAGESPAGAKTPPASGASPGEAKAPESPRDDTPYYMDFYNEVDIDGAFRKQRIRVPTLALVPIAPLAVSSAEIRFALTVREIGPHYQMQESERAALAAEEARAPKGARPTGPGYRPWFLVPEPVSVRGVLAPPKPLAQDGSSSAESQLEISVKVASIPIPTGLDKLLTALTQISEYGEDPRTKGQEPGKGKP